MTESARTEVTLENDPRLLAAVIPIVQHAAQNAGLDQQSQLGLVSAAVQACKETFPFLNGRESFLRMIVQNFPDRVEVAIEHPGEGAPMAGLDSFCGGCGEAAQGIAAALFRTQLDRVLYESRDGRTRVTLVKYRAECAPKK